METLRLKRFAQYARRVLIEQVSAKLKLLLAENSAARRENTEAIKKLEEAIEKNGKEQVVERVAYTWFNRFCALRFMDVNRYNRVNIVSPADPGQFQPEILAEAKMGHIDEGMVQDNIRQKIFALLDGKAPSRDPQGEAYRLLVVAGCNFWNKAMPFLFQRINDYTELLMPDDLLSGNSILAYTREAMTPDVCEDVEVIGWLYQFYISEKKDEVFEGLKKNKKITPENIPAATQLFTPHWIVRYLVENSLGRLWMLNRPDSKLVEQMEYYIKPEQAETDFLHIAKPDEIKICDPACGSGHMLTYAFDLLYAIYEEEGVDPAEIPEKILTNNLYGIEIDGRAGELAAFALTMKARSKQRRFFNKGIKPNICVLENVTFAEGELKNYAETMGRELFTPPVLTTLYQFTEADNFGSLIRPEVNGEELLQALQTKGTPSKLFLENTHKKVLRALQQAEYLSQRYHVVIANPPYMGGKGMNGRLGTWLKDEYEEVKSDLFSAFIVRNLQLALPQGQLGFMTPFVWMFISSYEKLRNLLIRTKTITSLVQLEYSGFDGATVPICTFTLENAHKPDFKGGYVRLSDFRGSENQGPRTLEAIQNPACGWFFRASAADFAKIPGSPIAYWVSERIRGLFVDNPQMGELIDARQGLATSDNNRFLRLWWEVERGKTAPLVPNHQAAIATSKKWFPLNKGGIFRKWYGNQDYLINWENNGQELMAFAAELYGSPTRTIKSISEYFKASVSWSDVTSATNAFRAYPAGFIFDATGHSAFPNNQYSTSEILAFCNSKLAPYLINILNPTMHFHVGYFKILPAIKILQRNASEDISNLQILSAKDWDAYETSWDFTSLPLLAPEYRKPTLAETYATLRQHWQGMTDEIQKLEEENNRIFIEAYGLQDELTPDVPLKEITLTCNPHYRYGGDKTPEELEALLLADTMREFISYAVGCMFGRYALDAPGLILANQGETAEDFSLRMNDLCGWGIPTHENADPQALRDATVERCCFLPDEDNVIPILDGYWFEDDMADRFRKFLRVAFGEEHCEENLQFIEQALGKNGKARDIREYFLKDFYSDHVKRYKKRPIYWLFSSPKGSFNALIYMHRYRPDTVSVVLNDYLREFRTKLISHKNHLDAVSISANASQSEKTKALKEIEKLIKMIAELEEYEREVLYPLATKQVEIDLDDGVKVNYPKFGTALKKIVGLDAKED